MGFVLCKPFRQKQAKAFAQLLPRPGRASHTPHRDPAPGQPPGERPRGGGKGSLPEAGLAPPGADPAHPQRQAQQAAQRRGHSQDLPALHGETALVRRYGTSHSAGRYRPARHRCPGPG